MGPPVKQNRWSPWFRLPIEVISSQCTWLKPSIYDRAPVRERCFPNLLRSRVCSAKANRGARFQLPEQNDKGAGIWNGVGRGLVWNLPVAPRIFGDIYNLSECMAKIVGLKQTLFCLFPGHLVMFCCLASRCWHSLLTCWSTAMVKTLLLWNLLRKNITGEVSSHTGVDPQNSPSSNRAKPSSQLPSSR